VGEEYRSPPPLPPTKVKTTMMMMTTIIAKNKSYSNYADILLQLAQSASLTPYQ
jgi:hypothetical protein